MVSVIVPVYNAESYLGLCVESLIHQTNSDIEIILVDDGSTDGSGRVCEQYREKDGRIAVIHKKNGGVSSARNAGLAVAKGEYIAFVDSDDWVHQDYLLCLRRGMASGAELSVCLLAETKEKEIEDMPIERKDYVLLDKSECFRRMLYSPKIGGFLGNKLFKKERIVHPFREDIHYSEDFVFCAQYAAGIGQAVFLDAPLYYYRSNEKSATHQYGVYHDRMFSLLGAERLLRELYLENLPGARDHMTLNLVKVALNLRARYHYNKCDRVKQYRELEEVIGSHYPECIHSPRIGLMQKLNLAVTRNFPVLSLKCKSLLLGRRLKR